MAVIGLIPLSGRTQDIGVAQPGDSCTYNIIEHICTVEGHSVRIPETLKQRLTRKPRQISVVTPSISNGGYRIQVFSDSNPRAQGEARAKASNINSKFPQWRSYVTYDAPYWRLRIGDFTNYEDANDALSVLKDAFPSYKRELRIIRDHINVGGY